LKLLDCVDLFFLFTADQQMLQSACSWSLEDVGTSSASSELKIRAADDAFEVVVAWDAVNGRVKVKSNVCAPSDSKFAHMDQQV
jgi:hypothetical protein